MTQTHNYEENTLKEILQQCTMTSSNKVMQPDMFEEHTDSREEELTTNDTSDVKVT